MQFKKILFFFLIFILILLFYFKIFDNQSKPLKKIIIPQGASTSQIAEILKNEEIIFSTGFFKVIVKIFGWEKDLKNGVYLLKPHSSIFKTIWALKNGQVSDIWVTIPEGFTLEEIAFRFEKELGVPSQKFLQIAKVKNFKDEFDFLPQKKEATLEGFLFPDTYRFRSFGVTPEEIIKPMLKRFEQLVMPLWREFDGKVQAGRKSLNLYEVLTLSSIVEKESMRTEEKPVIARVFLNRLGKGYLLNSCATVNYVLKKPHLVLTYHELKTPSPYNTYLHQGLPPGPICNPGLDSIRAVLNPDKNDYLYFVAGENGAHIFSKTLNDHIKAQKKYEKLNRIKEK